MGLGERIEKVVINRKAKEYPMIGKLLTLLVDTPGAKRTIATVLGVAAVVCRHLGPMFGELCDKGYSVACSLRGIAVFGGYADQVAAFVDKALVPGLDAATLVLGLVGLGHALARKP